METDLDKKVDKILSDAKKTSTKYGLEKTIWQLLRSIVA